MSAFYNAGLEGLLERSIPSDAVVMVCGLSDQYVFSANHTTFSDIEAAIVPGMEAQELGSATYNNGVLDGADMPFLAVNPGEEIDTVDSVALFWSWNDGDDTVLFAQLTETVGLPQALTGVNITIQWPVQGILKI